MKKNILLALSTCLLSFVGLDVSAQMKMRDVFAQMPDSVMPLLSKVNRLDCIDFIENNMAARVRNVLDDYVELEALTTDYMRLRTSEVTLFEARLLVAPDSTQILCTLSTAEVRGDSLIMADTNIRYYTSTWQPLSSTVGYVIPSVDDWLASPIPESDSPARLALQSLRSFHPMAMHFTAEDNLLHVTLQTSMLTKDERRALHPYLLPNLEKQVSPSL